MANVGGGGVPDWASLVEEVESYIEDARRNVNNLLSEVPEWLESVADALTDAWNWLMARLGEFWDAISAPYERPGNRVALRALVEEWKSQFATPLANLAKLIDPSALATDEEWSGKGAEKYEQTTEAQRKALSGFEGNVVNPVASALEKLAGGLDVFTTLMWTTIGTLVAGLISGIAALLTLIAAPAGVIAMVAALAAALIQIASANVQLDNAVSAGESLLGGVAGKATDWPAFAAV